MEETRILATIDETQLPAEKEVCEKHKEGLETKKHTDLFCMEDQTPICTVCRNSWDHAPHTVIPQKLEARKTNQGNGSALSGWKEGSPEPEPISATVGDSNTAGAFKEETLNGNKKVNADELLLLEQWVDFHLENKTEGTRSNSRVQNSITWILLVLFIIQIVGLVTTIFVFTMAKPNIQASVAAPPCCPHGWIMNQGHCYDFSELEGTWAAGQHHCSSMGASLAVIDSIEELNIAVYNKGPFNHWVGLFKEPGLTWKWPNGTLFNNLYEVEGDGLCAYLKEGTLHSTNCLVAKKWLCSQKVKTNIGNDSHCKKT